MGMDQVRGARMLKEIRCNSGKFRVASSPSTKPGIVRMWILKQVIYGAVLLDEVYDEAVEEAH